MNRITFFFKYIWYRGKDGVPGVRDFRAPCEDYLPGKPSGFCHPDGHYLCNHCQNRVAHFGREEILAAMKECSYRG